MDKRGAKILAGCMVCTIIIVILFLIVIRLPRPICEFIVLPENQAPRMSVPKNMKSRDQTLLIRVSAHLQTAHSELVLAGAGEGARLAAPVPGSLTSPNPAPPPTPATETGTTLKPGLLTINSSVPSVDTKPLDPFPNPLAAMLAASLNRSHPEPSKPSLADLAPKNLTTTTLAPTIAGLHLHHHHNHSVAPVAGAPNNESVATHPAKLYMPLELDSVTGRQLSDGRFKYTLNFNCSIVVLKVVRNPDRVYVDQISMEWRSTMNRKQKSRCELPVSGGTLGVDARQGAARCFHDGPIVYKCHPAPLDAPEMELHINSIEFEVAPAKNISQQFTQPRVACIL